MCERRGRERDSKMRNVCVKEIEGEREKVTEREREFKKVYERV